MLDVRLDVLAALEVEARLEKRLVAPRKPERLLAPLLWPPAPEETPALAREAALDADEEELEEDPEDLPPPLIPPPPLMSMVTTMPPPPRETFTLTPPPRPPRNCGAMRLTYFSAVVVPARRRVFSIEPWTTVAVRTRATARAPDLAAGDHCRHAYQPRSERTTTENNNSHGWPLRRRRTAGCGAPPGATSGRGSGAGFNCGCIEDSSSVSERVPPLDGRGLVPVSYDGGDHAKVMRLSSERWARGRNGLIFSRSCPLPGGAASPTRLVPPRGGNPEREEASPPARRRCSAALSSPEASKTPGALPSGSRPGRHGAEKGRPRPRLRQAGRRPSVTSAR